MVPDGNGDLRVSSVAFQNIDGGMSVGLSAVLDLLARDHLDVVLDFDGYGLLKFNVGWIRALPQHVTHSPTEPEPWHGDVVGKKSTGVKKTFVNNGTDWLRRPKTSESKVDSLEP